MERHRFDALSFIFGALFVTVAGIALAGPDLIALRDLRWVAPGLLVLAGAVLLLSTARGESPDAPSRDPERADDPSLATDDPGTDDDRGASGAPAMGRTDEAR